jgi:VanZ family protein
MPTFHFATAPQSRLPHTLAMVYLLAIAYASLQPFGPWIAPVPGTPFWPFAAWPPRWTRFDLIANIVAYVPLGTFVALIPRRAVPLARIGCAVAAGAAMSFAMETMQWFLPARDANLIDLAANTAGSLAGGLVAAAVARSERANRALTSVRRRFFLPGALGDTGIALLALWLIAQSNPGIALFAITYDPAATPLAAAGHDLAATLIEAAESALQLLGVGLFVAVLVRERRHVGGAVLALIVAALALKGAAALAIAKPAVWEGWLRPGVSTGVAGGALLLLFAVALPRPAMIALCAVALLSSVGVPLFATDLVGAGAPLTLFTWRYGQLMNFNGLTHTVLLLWPIAASVWLFALAGRPAWGRA